MTQMSPPVSPWFHKWHKIKQIIKATKEKEESSTEITVEQQQEEPLDRRMRRKLREIMKKEKCFACGKKTELKTRSRHWETLSRVERDDGSATLKWPMKKNEDL